MPDIREINVDLLGISAGKQSERIGLSLLAIGLLGFGLLFVWNPPLPLIKWSIVAICVLLGANGLERLLTGDRLYLDRRTESIFLRLPFMRHRRYSFSDAEKLTTKKRQTLFGGDELECVLLLKAGKALPVSCGAEAITMESAQLVAAFLSIPIVPLEEKT